MVRPLGLGGRYRGGLFPPELGGLLLGGLATREALALAFSRCFVE
jgi:hypothetical protein